MLRAQSCPPDTWKTFFRIIPCLLILWKTIKLFAVNQKVSGKRCKQESSLKTELNKQAGKLGHQWGGTRPLAACQPACRGLVQGLWDEKHTRLWSYHFWPYNLARSSCVLTQEDQGLPIHKDWMQIVTAAFIITTPSWKQPRRPSRENGFKMVSVAVQWNTTQQ